MARRARCLPQLAHCLAAAVLAACATAPIPATRPDCDPVGSPSRLPWEKPLGCFEGELAGATALDEFGSILAVGFTVCASGDLAALLVTALPRGEAPPPAVVAAVDRALQSCRWTPGQVGGDFRGGGSLASARLAFTVDRRPASARGPASPRCASGGEAVAFGAPGHQPPVEKVRGCLAHALPLQGWRLGGIRTVTVRLRVGADGCVGEAGFVESPDDAAVTRAVERAARECLWEPGRDARGRPVDMILLQAVRFSG